MATLFLLVACGSRAGQEGSVDLVVRVERVIPHDPAAFTQGLVLALGNLYESTGLVGKSTLRRLNLESGAVEQRLELEPEWFGEGLAVAGGHLLQLTWKNGVAVEYDLDFEERRRFLFEGEGWGVCHDGSKFIMTDGSDRLFFRDDRTFELLGSIAVRDEGLPVFQLNELECVDGLVYANVWMTNMIVAVDAHTGEVKQRIDASGLLSPAEAADADVLNGIAHDPTSGRFYVTGKLWPKLFEVLFVPP